MRGWFAFELHKKMLEDDRIWVVTGDLGYGVLDKIRRDFPERFINAGTAEQAMLGICVGLALQGKIPVAYSITTFLLYRPFEVIRNYINHENIPVKLIGSGRDKDYSHDGISHWSHDAKSLLDTLKNIVQVWPQEKEEIPKIIDEVLHNGKPTFLSLRR